MRLARKRKAGSSRRGRSDTLGRSGFAPLIGWILNSGHRQTTIPLSPCFFGHDDWNMYPTKSNIPTKCKTRYVARIRCMIFAKNVRDLHIEEKKKRRTYTFYQSSVAYANHSINSCATCVSIIHEHGHEIITRLFNNTSHKVQTILLHMLKFHLVK